MSDDDRPDKKHPTAPQDSEQAFRAFELQKVLARAGQGERGYGETSALLFEQAMAQTRMAICLSDPNQEDQPIVFANRAFQELTGYDEAEVIGRNCRFLQGPETDTSQVAKVRKAIDEDRVAVVELLNYRKNGEAFWNALHIGPIYDDDGKLLYLFGSQWDVTEVHVARAEQHMQRLLARELSHRMKNMFSVINAVVSMAGRGSAERRAIANDISGRILALGRAHEATLENTSKTTPSDLNPLVTEIMSAYDVRGQVEMSGGGAVLNSNIISMIALTVHELATNSVKYGALSVAEGRVTLDWQTSEADETTPGMLELNWLERYGPEISSAPETVGLGGRIVDNLIAAADGTVSRDWDAGGLTVTVCIPLSE